jgi:hypothetical protein
MTLFNVRASLALSTFKSPHSIERDESGARLQARRGKNARN